MRLDGKAGLLAILVVICSTVLAGCSKAPTRPELIVELQGADDTVWISGSAADHKQLADGLRLFAESQGWRSFAIEVQPNRVGLVTVLGRRIPGQAWSYELPASRLLQAVALNPREVRFGVKHNRLSAIETQDRAVAQKPFLLEPYPIIWYETTPETFRAKVTLFPANATRKALALWAFALLCSIAFAWLYTGRRHGTSGNVSLGLYYAAAITTFLVYFLTGLAFIWTWLAPSRVLGTTIGVVTALVIYLLTTAVVIGDYLARSRGTESRVSHRHLLRRSAVSWLPTFVGVIVNALLTVVLPDQYLQVLGGSATTLVITQAVILLAAFMGSPVFLRWVYRPLALQGHAFEVIQQSCLEHGISFHQIGYIPRDELGVANAFVAGILPNYRCLYLTEALLDELSDDELRAVVAHEVGHVKLRHFWWSILFSVGFGWAAVSAYRFLGIEGMNALQTIALPCTLLVFALTFAAVSRRFEYQADGFSAHALGSGCFLQGALDKLRHVNDANNLDIRWNPFATHPSISSRIRAL